MVFQTPAKLKPSLRSSAAESVADVADVSRLPATLLPLSRPPGSGTHNKSLRSLALI